MSAHQLIQAQLNNHSLDFLGLLDCEEADSEKEAMILQLQSKPISACRLSNWDKIYAVGYI